MKYKRFWFHPLFWLGALLLSVIVGISLLGGVAEAKNQANSYTMKPQASPTVYSPYTISGKVVDDLGTPISYVMVSASPNNGQSWVFTDPQGNYKISNVQPGTYDVTANNGYLYSPDKVVVSVPPSAENTNFQKTAPTPTPTVNPGQVFSISGRVTDHSGSGMANVEVDYGIGKSVTTNSDGFYQINGLADGTYTIAPAKDGTIFNPPSQEVPVPLSKANINFRQVCVSDVTGLNVCSLQVGDILFYRGTYPLIHGNLSDIARIAVGSYWWHAAIYIGNGQIAQATGPNDNLTEQVETEFISSSSWWKGSNLDYDWAVIRPKATESQKQLAANYALQMANQINPPVLYVAAFSDFFDRESDSPTYCDKFVWKAYMQSNINLEQDFGVLGGTVFRDVITGDDLYYSAFDIGSLSAKSELVQEKDDPTNNRAIFFLLSPADMLLTDSLGRRVGHDPLTDTSYEEIPGAWHTGSNAEPESISLNVSKNLTWTLSIVGTGQGGQYTLKTAILTGTLGMTSTLTSTILPNEKKVYQFTNKPSATSDLLKDVSTPLDTTKKIYLPVVER